VDSGILLLCGVSGMSTLSSGTDGWEVQMRIILRVKSRMLSHFCCECGVDYSSCGVWSSGVVKDNLCKLFRCVKRVMLFEEGLQGLAVNHNPRFPAKSDVNRYSARNWLVAAHKGEDTLSALLAVK